MKKLVLFLFFLGFVLSAYSATWERVYLDDTWGDIKDTTLLRQVSTGVVNERGSSKPITTVLGIVPSAPCCIHIFGIDDFNLPFLYEDESVNISFRSGEKMEACKGYAYNIDSSCTHVVFFDDLDYREFARNISEIVFDDSFEVIIEGKDWYLRSSFRSLPFEPESLWFAIRTGNIDYVRTILERLENSECKIILNNPFELDDVYYNSYDYLEAVISVHNLDILNLLIQKGYDIRKDTKIYTFDLSIFPELFELGLNPRISIRRFGTPEPLANILYYEGHDDSKVMQNKLQCLRKMIESGLNVKDPLYLPIVRTTILNSWEVGRFEQAKIFIEELLKMGFSADYLDSYNEGVLFDVWRFLLAVRRKEIYSADFFDYHFAKEWLLGWMNLFVEHGANVNKVNYIGETCLLQMVKRLTLSEKYYKLPEKISFREPGEGGLTGRLITENVLDFCIPELLRLGADVTVTDYTGKSAIDYISEYEAEHDGEVNAFNLIKAEYQKQIAK